MSTSILTASAIELQWENEKTSISVPPSTDRGAQPSNREELGQRGLEFKIDWNSFTLPARIETLDYDLTVDDVFSLIGYDRDVFVKLPKGRYGYAHALVWNNITVMYNEPIDRQGIHVDMSGQGCRWFERTTSLLPADYANTVDAWLILWSKVMDLCGKFTRLDLAIDDFKGYFTVQDVIEKVQSGDLTSQFRGSDKNPAFTVTLGYNPTSEGATSTSGTVYCGTPSSRLRIRIYDKAKKEGYEGHWVRTELQLRDERAVAAVAFIVGGHSIGEITCGTLRNYLNFRERSETESNKSKWEVSSWWLDFLGDVEKVKLTTAPVEKTLDEVEQWVDKQIMPTLAMLNEYYGDQFVEHIMNSVRDAKPRMSKRHYVLLHDALDMVEELERRADRAVERNEERALNRLFYQK